MEVKTMFTNPYPFLRIRVPLRWIGNMVAELKSTALIKDRCTENTGAPSDNYELYLE